MRVLFFLILVVLSTFGSTFGVGREGHSRSFSDAIERLRQSYPDLNLPYVPSKKTMSIFRFRRAPRPRGLDYRIRLIPNYF
ncbi:hypothetical protein L596_024454 [Steinernema carpocapsae]|uniref:Uncharacterized protein n=1 Tax=Steinernema carpocapsae TaxID=34508 RepID=A0A4U5MGT6_STECR|nr:hypothetical protein L596_024454 [Steinernema carpocapsae]